MASDTNINRLLSSDAPMWARIVYVIGVPSAIAIFLIYFVTNQVSGAIGNIRTEQAQIREELRLHAVDSSYVIKETTSIRMILQQICANTAATREERNMCFNR